MLILVAPIPMSRYRRLQIMGKTIAGGESGGCFAKLLKSCEPSLVSQADNPPTDSVRRIQKMYDFHGSFFKSNHPAIGYVQLTEIYRKNSTGIPVLFCKIRSNLQYQESDAGFLSIRCKDRLWTFRIHAPQFSGSRFQDNFLS